MAEALKDSYIETHDQENFFYEGSEKELNKARVSLRTRFYGGNKKCVITMKVHASAAFVAVCYTVLVLCCLKSCPTMSACCNLTSKVLYVSVQMTC